MKNIIFICCIVALTACNTSKNNHCGNRQHKNQPTDSLDKLLDIGSEEELIKMFGKKNVVYDTVFGLEGDIMVTTILFPESPNQVVFHWSDIENRKNASLISHSAYYDAKKEKYITNSRWKTKYGFSVGTPMMTVVELNGQPIEFYGFGWDFGGAVNNYNGGKFENQRFSIMLSPISWLTEDGYLDSGDVSGDGEFSSNNPTAQKMNLVVVEISIFH